MAVVRAVAALKPDGAADALLDYLPYAEDDKVEQEIESALAAVALSDGKPESALVRALTDTTPVRRAAAAVALCRVGGREPDRRRPRAAQRPQADRPLPRRHGPGRRLQADAVPVLIDLLADLPTSSANRPRNTSPTWPANGPWPGRPATTPPPASLRRDAWTAWWHGIDDKVLLDEFKSRTMTDAERDEALALIQKLDDVSADVREKASTELVGMGLPRRRRCSARRRPAPTRASGRSP